MKETICRLCAFASVIFNFVCFYLILRPHIQDLGYWPAIVESVGWEFPPFWPPSWVVFNFLGVFGYATGNGYFTTFNLADYFKLSPAMLFILGSAVQSYLFTRLPFFSIDRLRRLLQGNAKSD